MKAIVQHPLQLPEQATCAVTWNKKRTTTPTACRVLKKMVSIIILCF